ncbi:MAG: hypothetical protein HKN44_15130 [Ilumatobacter sp.]|nr:hypothetical protein [Ilumatobacter sp.]
MTGLLAPLCVGAAVVVAAQLARPSPPPRATTVVAPRPRPRAGGGVSTVMPTVRRSMAVVAALFIGGPALAGVALVAIMLWARLGPHRSARRVRHRIAADLPDAVDLFVLAVTAGLTPRQAVGQLAGRAPASVRPAFAAVVARLERGEILADALRALDELLGPAATSLSTIVGSADRHGLPLAGVLDRLAAESRASRRRLDEAAARALPVKLSFPLVACTLPSFVLLAIVPAVLAALSSLGAHAW